MALQPGSFFESDATGAAETITLQASAPNTATNAMIASAFYGTDAAGAPKPTVKSADGKSITFTVLKGNNQLVITIVSPNPTDETVNLCQGVTILANPTVRNHSAVSTMLIQGT